MARVLALAVLLASAQGWAMQDPQASACGEAMMGRNYSELRSKLPTRAADGKVEVLELFTYGCRECDALQPYLSRWLAESRDDVQLVRVPVVWRHVTTHARLYYTLVVLGRTDLHQAVFDAIFRQGRLLEAADVPEAFFEQIAFAREHGISEADFTDAYHSSFVQGYLEQAREISRVYCKPDVPTLVINGRLITDVSRAGNGEAMVQVAKTLVARERALKSATLPPVPAVSACSRPSGEAHPQSTPPELTSAGAPLCDAPDAG